MSAGSCKEQTAKEENKQTSGRNEQNKQTVWRVKIKPTNGSDNQNHNVSEQRGHVELKAEFDELTAMLKTEGSS